MVASSLALDRLVSLLGPRIAQAELLGSSPPPLSLAWPELDALLPDGGLPRGVVEIASPRVVGGATAIALSAIRAAHARDPKGWCAWLDPEATLYGPGLVFAGVDLARLLVVRPPRTELARVAVRVASAGAFDVLVVDMDAIAGARPPARRSSGSGARSVARTSSGGTSAASTPPACTSATLSSSRRRAWPPEVLVRKLALLAEESGGTVVLLTDARQARAVPWPVSLRLEVSRAGGALTVRVGKEKRGRVGSVREVPLRTRPLASGIPAAPAFAAVG